MKLKLTQETFDAAVQENIDEFGMEPDEAVNSAVQEFQTLGMDLTGIIKTVNGGNVQSHPLCQDVDRLRRAAEAAPVDCAMIELSCEEASVRMASAKKIGQADEMLEIATKVGLLGALLETLKALDPSNLSTVTVVLATLKVFLGNYSTREQFWEKGGPSLVTQLVTEADGFDLMEAVATVAAAAATKHEANKCAFVDEGFGRLAAKALRQTDLSEPATLAIAASLKAFATADDDRPAASKAFQNGRTMAKEGVLEAMLEVLTREPSPAVMTALLSAAKRLAVNEEICRDFADAGGLKASLSALQSNMGDASLVKSACGLVRQLANSDELKEATIEAGGLDLLNRAVAIHSASPATIEQALGLLVALTLRNPSAGQKAVEAGCVDTVVDVMKAVDTNPKTAATAQWVQRQACMSIRNIAGRNTALRPILLNKGVEDLLRQAKQRFPAACHDVGSAALRDLGIENYND
eukprot:jgi/Botrbrau1/14835/Bobra.0278s0005.1